MYTRPSPGTISPRSHESTPARRDEAAAEVHRKFEAAVAALASREAAEVATGEEVQVSLEELQVTTEELAETNAALTRLVAAMLDTAPRDVRVAAGATARIKQVKVSGHGATLAAALARKLASAP